LSGVLELSDQGDASTKMIFASAPTPAGHCLDHTGTPAAGVFGGGGKTTARFRQSSPKR
jgi:hypothetical protein